MTADWRFLLRPKWLLSHLFVVVLLVSFTWAGFWQLDRMGQAKDQNAAIEARSALAPIPVDALESVGTDEVNFRPIADTGHYADTELIRVANRSLDGVAGDWVVAHFVTDSGLDVLVNRGFISRDHVASEPLDDEHLAGWFRDTEVKDGAFGATDTGEGERVPRLDVEVLADRFDIDAVPAWVQLAPVPVAFDGSASMTVLPEALELPALTSGNHFSYAVQWFLFAILGLGAYLLVLRKLARQRVRDFTSDSAN